MVHDLAVQVEPITWHHGVAELRLVDAQEEHEIRRRVEGLGGVSEDAADLREGLEDEHARHDGAMGEVSLKPGLVVRHALVATYALVRDDLIHPVDHHEWESVGKDLKDSVNVQADSVFVRGHYRPRIILATARSQRMRSTAG